MKKIIFEEINNIRYLFSYQPGTVISEQKVKKTIFEVSTHSENLYKSWANKKSGNPELALSLMNDFFDLQKQLSKKDFSLYTSSEELKSDIDRVKSKSQEKKPEDDANLIYKNGDLLVIAANTWEAGCKYGSGTKWCTASKDNSSYWGRHNNEGTEFIWIKKDIPSSNPIYKVSLHIRDNNYHDWCNAINRCGKESPYKIDGIQIPNFDSIFKLCMDYHSKRVVEKNEKRKAQLTKFKDNPNYRQMMSEYPIIFDRIYNDEFGIAEILIQNLNLQLRRDISHYDLLEIEDNIYNLVKDTLYGENGDAFKEEISNRLLIHMGDFIFDNNDEIDSTMLIHEIETQLIEMIIEELWPLCFELIDTEFLD